MNRIRVGFGLERGGVSVGKVIREVISQKVVGWRGVGLTTGPI